MPRPNFPLFRRYARAYLVEITGLTPDYLKKIRLGIRPATQRFRDKVVAALSEEGVDEETLFGKGGPSHE